MQKIDKRLDEAWSELVKIRASYRCEYCYKPGTLNSHHIYSRSKRSVRWNPKNGVCLCASHHALSSKFSAHKTPVEFLDWITLKRGKQFIDALRVQANYESHLHKFEKELLLKDLNKEIKTYEL